MHHVEKWPNFKNLAVFTSQDFKDQSSFNTMNEKVKSHKWNFFKKI